MNFGKASFTEFFAFHLTTNLTQISWANDSPWVGTGNLTTHCLLSALRGLNTAHHRISLCLSQLVSPSPASAYFLTLALLLQKNWYFLLHSILPLISRHVFQIKLNYG